MEIIVDNQVISVPMEHLNRIKQKYNPHLYIKTFKKNHLIFIAYERVLKGVDIYYAGYTLNLKSPSLSTFSKIRLKREEYTLEDKFRLVQKYLGELPDTKEKLDRLLTSLFWLYDNTAETLF